MNDTDIARAKRTWNGLIAETLTLDEAYSDDEWAEEIAREEWYSWPATREASL